MLYVHLVGLVQENKFSNWSFKKKTRQNNSYYKSLNKERRFQQKIVNCEVSQWKFKFWYFCRKVFIQKKMSLWEPKHASKNQNINS